MAHAVYHHDNVPGVQDVPAGRPGERAAVLARDVRHRPEQPRRAQAARTVGAHDGGGEKHNVYVGRHRGGAGGDALLLSTCMSQIESTDVPLDDLWTLDLAKLDGWRCIKENSGGEDAFRELEESSDDGSDEQ